MNTFKKILDLLTPLEKRRAVLLLFLILMSAFIDVLGVVSILPFIGLLANPNLIETDKFLLYLYNKSNLIGINSNQQFLFAVGIMVFTVFIFSLFIRAITNYAQIRFAYMREYTIGKRLLERYLFQPYSWFLNKNSSDFGKNILSEVSYLIHNVLIPIINLIAHSIVAIVMLILVIIVDPELAFAVGSVLFLSYGITFYLIKKYLSSIGAKRTIANKDRFKGFSEAFGAIKELKLNGLEKNYIERFSSPAEIFAKNHSIAQSFAQMPRYVIEAVAFGGMIILVLFLINKTGDFSKIISFIALYAFVGYRLIPATQHIYSSIALIRFSRSALRDLHNEFMSLKKPDVKKISLAQSISLSKLIDLRDISYSYPGSTVLTLKNISIRIPAFSKVGVVGTTGSGKSTLIDLILGLLEMNKGTIRVDENIINKQNIRSWQDSISYVPQQIFLSDISIAENIAFGHNFKNIDLEALEKAAKIANLHEFVSNELPEGYKTLVGERGVRLSGGQRQRIGIARAFYNKPKILILDEATSALDNLTEKKVMDNIQNLKDKITIIIVAHRLSTVKNCEKIFILEKGEIKDQGTYEELIANNKAFLTMAST